MRATVLILAISVLLVTPVLAQVQVSLASGNSLAYTCFVSALRSVRGMKTTATNVADCTAALGEPMTEKIRAATFDNRGILYNAMENNPAALEDFNTSIHLDSNLSDAWLNRGVTLIKMRKAQDALSDIQRGIELGTSVPHIAYFDLGVAEETLGHATEAYNDYTHSLALQAGFRPAVDALKNFRVLPAASHDGRDR